MLLFLRVWYFVLLLINFTQIIVANKFCDKSDEYEEIDKCNIQLRYSRNRFEFTCL